MSEIDAELLSDVADVAQTEAHIQPQKAETKTETETKDTSEEEELVGDDQDFDRTDWDDREREDGEPSQKTETETKDSEETETETKTKTQESESEPEGQEEDVNAWMKTLPPPPPEFSMPAPELDEEGNLSNMTPEQFAEYNTQRAVAAMRNESYNQMFFQRSLEEAEKVLPEMKENPVVRNMVQNQIVAATINGQQYTAVDAARDIKTLLGDAKSAGAQSQRTSVTIQKAAGLESPTNQKKTAPSKIDKIAKRLKAGDKSAADDLFAAWIEDGKI